MIHNCVKRRKPLNVRIEGAVAHVTVSGKTFMMDAGDLPLLEGWTLHVSQYGYIIVIGTRRVQPMFRAHLSRVLMGAPSGTEVDHISGDPMDNRRCNLRICTRVENSRNTKSHTQGRALYKGCSYNKSQGGKRKWKAELRDQGTRHYLGYFLTASEAARAYNAKAIEVFGEFARINIIDAPGRTLAVARLRAEGATI